MAYDTGSGVRQGLWCELSRTLRRLEAIAARPPGELGEELDELSGLRYSLHRLSERLVGLRPPPGLAGAHSELAAALAAARDATAELAEAAELDGREGAAPLVYEWRGALFRLRLAWMTLRTPGSPPPEPRPAVRPDPRAAIASLGLTATGAAAFVGGALAAAWPLWAAGMIAVVAGLLVYRP
jgi:hypothetical protein